MPLSGSQVKAEQAGLHRRNVSVFASLFLVIESVSRGGGKSFEGRMRFPPGRQGKQVPVRIGVYGKGIGKWSLKEARDEWDRIRSWSKQRDYYCFRICWAKIKSCRGNDKIYTQ